MNLTPAGAWALLTQGLNEPETKMYVTHCRYVGELAGLIAGELGADPEYARALGFLHDIGRKIDTHNHMYAGYRHLQDLGYPEYAFICLTHSFLGNDIGCTCGRQLSPLSEGYAEVKAFVEGHENTLYDKIIQTCDLLCMHSGGVTLEQRIADVESRKGTHVKSAAHRAAAFAQKAELEAMLGHSIYDLYEELEQRRRIPMKQFLVVVDMQKDFVDGALGTAEAVAIVPAVTRKIASFDGEIFATFDTHAENYLETAEGKKLPVTHCVKGTPGWALDAAVAAALESRGYTSVEKKTFGSVDLPGLIEKAAGGEPFGVTLIGLCTDICVVSNALLLKAHFPETPIAVDAACCAGVTPAAHEAALATMRSCQIDIL